MIGGRRFLAVIPARGGSVSVPRKNIKPLAGQPLLLHTVKQTRAVPELDLVVVSTDDQEIGAVATAAGVRVVNRPAALATNEAPTEGALIHALDALRDEAPFDYVVVLEPTSPLRTAATIRRCMTAIVSAGAPSLVTVRETRASLGRLVNGHFVRLDPQAPRRRQDREPYYYESSTVYVAAVEHLRRTGSLIAEPWLSVPVPDDEALDINSPIDFDIAEILLNSRARPQP